jgi:hypothetical protein
MEEKPNEVPRWVLYLCGGMFLVAAAGFLLVGILWFGFRRTR